MDNKYYIGDRFNLRAKHTWSVDSQNHKPIHPKTKGYWPCEITAYEPKNNYIIYVMRHSTGETSRCHQTDIDSILVPIAVKTIPEKLKSRLDLINTDT
jgi:hypothetical protein